MSNQPDCLHCCILDTIAEHFERSDSIDIPRTLTNIAQVMADMVTQFVDDTDPSSRTILEFYARYCLDSEFQLSAGSSLRPMQGVH